jgi:hypothetical protein
MDLQLKLLDELTKSNNLLTNLQKQLSNTSDFAERCDIHTVIEKEIIRNETLIEIYNLSEGNN